MSEVKRETLSKIASLVRPALATQSYIPALTHICFDGEYATAYNDISAISVKAEIGLQLCVPGDYLIRALNSFPGEEVVVKPGVAGGIKLSCGRAKLELPTMQVKDFPFELPESNGTQLDINDDILKGIERCRLSVGVNTAHPAQMGVTLESEEGRAVLYSTDNFSISRYSCKTKLKLPGDTPVILPTFFCDQMLSLAKAFPDDDLSLELGDDCLIATFGKSAILFTKIVVDLEPLDFGKIIKKNLNGADVRASLAPIPDSFDLAFGRQLLVLSQEMDKSTKVKFDGETLKLRSHSQLGDADDTMRLEDKEFAELEFFVDPTLVLRAAKVCTHLALFPKVLVMGDEKGTFIHLIAHCSE